MLKSRTHPVNSTADPSVDESAPRPGDDYVQSLARGLAVLRSFGAQAPAQTLTETAQRTGLTRAGARRLLLTLQQLGYVESDGRQFRLTPQVLELGFAYLSAQPIWQLAQPAMEALGQSLGESCSAAVLDGDEIVYVLRVSARKIMALDLGVGSRLPAHCTSMGRVLLAGLPVDELPQKLAAMELKALTPHTLTNRDRLLGVITQVRAQGYSVVNEELEPGLISMAAPLVNRAGRVVAALNISGQSSRTPLAHMTEHFLPHLLATAAQINALICTQ